MPSIAVPVALNSYGISCYLDRKGKRKSRTFFAQSKHFDFCETVSSEQNITNRSNAMLGSLHSGQCHENNQSFTIHSLQVVSLCLDGIIDNDSRKRLLQLHTIFFNRKGQLNLHKEPASRNESVVVKTQSFISFHG